MFAFVNVIRRFSRVECWKHSVQRTWVARVVSPQNGGSVLFLLWLIAVVLVVSGIVAAVRGAVLYGIVVIVIGLLVGPRGVSIIT
jgi:hypothetical protein